MKFLLFALSLLALTSTAFAEETTRKAGDASLNFSLVKTQLQQYKFGFGGKFWTSSSIVHAASFDVGTNETDNNNKDSGGGTYSSNSDDSYYALSYAIERHLQTSSLSPYVGLELKYSRYSYDYSDEYTSSSYSYRSESSGKQYGIAVLAGAEYAFNKNISLAGEYGYGFSYLASKYQNKWNNQTYRSRGFDLSVGRLALLLYF